MSDRNCLLDTSALMAYIDDEPGADDVADFVDENSVCVPWSALLELYYNAIQEHDEDEALLRYASLRDAPGIRVLWSIDESLLLTAARIRAKHRVSFADALIAAYAVQQEAVLLHRDPKFDLLGDQVLVHRLPYK